MKSDEEAAKGGVRLADTKRRRNEIGDCGGQKKWQSRIHQTKSGAVSVEKEKRQQPMKTKSDLNCYTSAHSSMCKQKPTVCRSDSLNFDTSTSDNAHQIDDQEEGNKMDDDIRKPKPNLTSEELKHVAKQEEPVVTCPKSNVTDPSPPPPPPPPLSVRNEFQKLQHSTQGKIQNVVELVMWKDVSRSAFAFGFGSFILLSSTVTNNLNFSAISAVSYMGLFYLAATFLYRSFLCCRSSVSIHTQDLVGEEEVVWLLHFLLPYLNAFIFNLKTLFSGDPATTFKLAIILFVLARCGNSITIWNLANLGFFVVFTVPKVCSSYSPHFIKYGKFWLRRFKDAWNSCNHKKVVVVAIFAFIWNLSSITSRVWAAFMLVVAIRYYQHPLCLLTEERELEQGQEDEE